jgi:hypothetical protein
MVTLLLSPIFDEEVSNVDVLLQPLICVETSCGNNLK